MDPELARFESEQPNIQYTHVNMDERDGEPYKKYGEYFKGRSIPFTVLIDTEGKARKEWVGYLSYPDMVNEIVAIAGESPAANKGKTE